MNTPSLVETCTSKLARHPWRVLLLALVLTGFSVWCAVKIPILTSRKVLLPQKTGVSQRLERFLQKFGAASDLIVVLEGAARPDLEKFATELAERLRRRPVVRQAFARVDLLFFFKHAYLLVPPKQLQQFNSVLKKLIGVPAPEKLKTWDEAFHRAEAWLNHPPPLSSVEVDLQTAEESLHLIRFFLEEWQRWLDSAEPPEEIAWQKLLARHGAGALAAGKGFFSSRDNRMLFLFVRPSESSEEFSAIEPFIAEVRREAEELRSLFTAHGHQAPKVAFTGLPAVIFEEVTTVNRDVGFTVSTATLLILLLIGFWLRSLRWALVIFVPMGLGVLWNIGLTFLLVGHLTILTSGFTAILFGLGVDYGIFMSSRIMEECARGHSTVNAISRGVGACAKAILTAGGATVLIFGALGLVPFTGFAELGVVAAAGVLLIVLATFLVQPALFALLPPSASRAPAAGATAAPKTTAVSFSALSCVLLVSMALVGAGIGAVAGSRITFDYNPLSLLPRGSEVAHYQKRMAEESDFQGEVVIFTAPNVEEAQRLYHGASKLSSIAQLHSVTNLFPPDAEERAGLARQIGTTVSGSAYLQKIMQLGEVKLTTASFSRIRSSIEEAKELLADSEELAFSAGHQHLVELFESIISRMELIKDRLKNDPNHAMLRTENYAQTILDAAHTGFETLSSWKNASELTPPDLPVPLQDRFFAADGSVAIYAYPAQSVYLPENLNLLMKQVYSVSAEATGFPTTHQVFSRMALESFLWGTLLAVAVAMTWIILVLRNLRGFVIALLPLLVGGGWMMGVIALLNMKFNYASIIALPLVL